MTRRIASFTLMLCLTVLLSACGKSAESTNTSADNTLKEEPSTTSVPTTQAATAPKKTEATTTAPVESTTAPAPEPVLVTWNDVVSGAFEGQTICIDGIADNVHYSSGKPSGFNMFFEHDGICDIVKMYFSSEDETKLKSLAGLKNGDVLRISQIVSDSPTVGQGFITAEKIGERSLDEIHAEYKAGCPDLDYDGVSRMPEETSEQEIKCKYSGRIAQVIEKGSEFNSPKYLVESNGNYIYVDYFRAFENREINFLEDDNVTVYGNFVMMKTYDTLLGTKTVPELSVYLMELN